MRFKIKSKKDKEIIKAYKENLSRRMTIKEYRKVAEESLIAAREGRTISHSELETLVGEWG